MCCVSPQVLISRCWNFVRVSSRPSSPGPTHHIRSSPAARWSTHAERWATLQRDKFPKFWVKHVHDFYFILCVCVQPVIDHPFFLCFFLCPMFLPNPTISALIPPVPCDAIWLDGCFVWPPRLPSPCFSTRHRRTASLSGLGAGQGKRNRLVPCLCHSRAGMRDEEGRGEKVCLLCALQQSCGGEGRGLG